MRKVFGPEKEEVFGDCRKQHNEKFDGLYCSKGNTRILVINTKGEMGWECGTCGRKINACRILMGKPVGRRTFWKTWA
jgi:polyferredoxin